MTSMIAIILAAFAGSLLLSLLTRVHPVAYGCLLPFAAAGLFIFIIERWPNGSSTEAVGIPFVFAFAAFGSIPGAFVAGLIRSRKGEEF